MRKHDKDRLFRQVVSKSVDHEPLTRNELLEALRRAEKAHVWVRCTTEDGTYFRVTKREAIRRVKHDLPGEVTDADEIFLAFVDDENPHALYIN